MKQIKTIACIGLAVIMLLANTSTASAAGHKTGCGSNLKAVICGSLVGNVNQGTHILYVTANGGVVGCSIVWEQHFHTIKCTSCETIFQTNAVRTCLEKHTSCPPHTGMCQYQ